MLKHIEQYLEYREKSLSWKSISQFLQVCTYQVSPWTLLQQASENHYTPELSEEAQQNSDNCM